MKPILRRIAKQLVKTLICVTFAAPAAWISLSLYRDGQMDAAFAQLACGMP